MARIAPVVGGDSKDGGQDPVAVEYSPVWIVSRREGMDGRLDIHFKVCKPQSATADQISLHADVEKTLTAIHGLFGGRRNNPRYEEVVEKLLMLSQLGLVGVRGEGNPTIARYALGRLQDEIAELDGARVKNDFLKKLGMWSVILSFPAWLVLAFFYYFQHDVADRIPLVNICALWSSNQIGTWISFATRKLDIGFFDLARIGEDQFEPPIRLFFTGVLSIIFALTIWAGLFSIQIGDFNASGWVSNPLVAVVLGALMGIAEKALPGSVRNKAEKLISG